MIDVSICSFSSQNCSRWKKPSRQLLRCSSYEVLPSIVNHLLELERTVMRRYLKPPLRDRYVHLIYKDVCLCCLLSLIYHTAGHFCQEKIFTNLLSLVKILSANFFSCVKSLHSRYGDLYHIGENFILSLKNCYNTKIAGLSEDFFHEKFSAIRYFVSVHIYNKCMTLCVYKH